MSAAVRHLRRAGPAGASRSRSVLGTTDRVVALAQDARLQFEADDPA
jgi:hypothetical protein